MIPNLTGIPWADGLIITAAVLSAISFIWRKITRFGPLRWIIRRLITQPIGAWTTGMVDQIVDRHTEPLRTQLTTNNGSSLVDKVDQLVEGQKTSLAWQDAHAASDATEFSTLAASYVDLTDRLTQLNDYTHQRMHDVLNKIAIAGFTVDTVTQIAADVEDLKTREAENEP